MRQRQLRMDLGRSLLLEMRPARTPILDRTLGTCRIRTKTSMYLLTDLQAIRRLQAVGLRLTDFLPIKCSINEVLRHSFAAVAVTDYSTNSPLSIDPPTSNPSR